jgi:outer membrane lipoprotein LolB
MEFDDPEEQAYYQAQAAEALDYRRKAIDYYGRIKSGDRALAAAIRRAELLALDGDVATARSELRDLRLQADELTIEESWLAEARILRETGDRDQAFRLLDEAVQQLPHSIPILYTRALLAAELGWVDAAERDLRVILGQQPENAAALNALGYTLADQTERFDEAEALIRQAYILQPNESSIIDSMGWVAYKQGRFEEAEQFLRRAWQLDRNPEIAAHLGEVLWQSGKLWALFFDFRLCVCSLLPLAASVLLTACATAPLSDAEQAQREPLYQQRSARLEHLASWALEGRLAVSDDQDGGSGSFRWQRDGAGSRMDFHGALGRGAWRMLADKQSAELTFADGATYRAASVETLVREQVGWPVPVEMLGWWVRGLADARRGWPNERPATGRLGYRIQPLR